MDVDGHIELLNDGPKSVILRLVVEENGILAGSAAGQLPIVQQGPVEAVLFHASVKLLRRLFGVVH